MTATFRGTVSASAVVLDPALVGEDEARRRAMRLGRVELSELPDGRWLAVLDAPVEVRLERAPGLALVSAHGGLTHPGLPATAGAVTLLSAGAPTVVPLEGLPAVATDGWLDLTGLATHRLAPLDEASREPERPAEPPRLDPDLAAAAGLRRRGRPAGRRLDRLGRSARLSRRARTLLAALAVLAVLGAVAAIVAVVAVSRDAQTSARQPPSARATAAPRSTPSVDANPSTTLPYGVSLAPGLTLPPGAVLPTDFNPTADGPSEHIVLTPLLCLAVLGLGALARAARGRSAGGRATHAGARRPGPLRRWVRRLVSGPAAGYLARRQRRYLAALSRRFEARRWDDLLREGIALGGAGDGRPRWLSLRMPERRDSLLISATSHNGGAAVGFGVTAFAYLRRLYSETAHALERSGEVDRAVFVHAELLRDAPAAVTLLEQQGRLRPAAELAEGRGLEAGLVVRLWWRAGERAEAVRVARARGAFAEGVSRLEQVDPEAAVHLRRAWMESCRQASDPLGAVEAAWPVAELRREVRADLAAGVALGGEQAGRSFARLLAEFPSEQAVTGAVALMEEEDRSTFRARRGFLDVLAQEQGRDRVADRRVCSAALRTLLREEPTEELRRYARALRGRADPLLRADLPAFGRARGSVADADLMAPEEPGRLDVLDAVALSGGAVLVAHGGAGVRLYSAQGRTRARWDVVAHDLIVADNGASALLVRHAGALREVYRLDLLTRRVRPWTTLRAQFALRSFDGSTLAVVDRDGIAFLDTLSERPRVLWRELDSTHRVHAVNRTADRLTAVVTASGIAGPLTQLWVWELPSRVLRVRRVLRIGPQVQRVLAGDAAAVLVAGDGTEDATLTTVREYHSEVAVRAPADTVISTDSGLLASAREVGVEILCTLETESRSLPAHARFPASADSVRARAHGEIVTVFDRSGRIVAADLGGGGSARFATRA